MTPKGVMSLFLGVMEGPAVAIATLSFGTLFTIFQTGDNYSVKYIMKAKVMLSKYYI